IYAIGGRFLRKNYLQSTRTSSLKGSQNPPRTQSCGSGVLTAGDMNPPTTLARRARGWLSRYVAKAICSF
ncbi:MAG: hypothetical protein WBL39_14765, partial [Terrimicrobiaceae bacterium]